MTLERPLLCDVRHTDSEILLVVTNETCGNKRARLNSTHLISYPAGRLRQDREGMGAFNVDRAEKQFCATVGFCINATPI